MINVDSNKHSKEYFYNKYGSDAILADVTMRSRHGLALLSPEYRWRDIPVPYTNGLVKGCSIMDIWKDLAVWSGNDINKDLLGFKRGPNGEPDKLLSQAEARLQIIVPTYRFVLDYKVNGIINRLRRKSETKDVVLLDSTTNCDISDTSTNLSHAFLVKAYAEGLFPYEDVYVVKDVHHYWSNGRWEYHSIVKTKEEAYIPPYNTSYEAELPFDIIYP